MAAVLLYRCDIQDKLPPLVLGPYSCSYSREDYLSNHAVPSFQRKHKRLRVVCIRQFLTTLNAPLPLVFIPDGDAQLVAALGQYFPGVQQQRCIFHKNQNVIEAIKKHWVKPVAEPSFPDLDSIEDEECLNQHHNQSRSITRSPPTLGGVPEEVANTRTGLYLLWEHMVYGSSKQEF